MKYPDFAQCKEAAIKVLETTKGNLCYGLYTPLTDRKLWDDRWYDEGCKSFLHWWVETGSNIIDAGSRQFGESGYKVLPLDDKRYIKAGYEIDNEKYPLQKSPVKVQWESLIPFDKVNITFENYYNYLRELKP